MLSPGNRPVATRPAALAGRVAGGERSESPAYRDQPTLVLVAHGSRDPRFAATARRVAAATRRALPDTSVELAYLDLNEPRVDDLLDALSGEVTVLPLLFGDGYHSKIDLPKILAEAAGRNRSLHAAQTEVVGHYSPVPALIDRLMQAAYPARLTAGLGVVLYAVGSSDPASDASVRARGRELAEVLGVPVETVFATRLGPDGAALRDAVARLQRAGATRIAASPLFLSAGLLTERVERVLDDVAPGSLVAGPIADHPALVDAIAHLYRAALPAATSPLTPR